MRASTIAAIATPPGSGGIGIIKISGPQAVTIAFALFRRAGTAKRRSEYRSHRLYHGTIVDPLSGETVDEVLLSVMRAPHSYTREDVVEINSHSGGLLLQRILKLVLERGARLAEPGEFTLRAFTSGRIDLTQAEAVADLINARSESALKVAAAQLGGEMGRQIGELRDSVERALSMMYACMDFGDENGLDDPMQEGLVLLRENVMPALEKLIRRYEDRRYLRSGIRVVIAGRPNVGKSTLMNQLVGHDRAIVTPVPGTTRDIIDHQFVLKGVSVILVDTAGIRKSDDPVERIGIQRAREAVRDADLVLALFDASQAFSEEDRELVEMVRGCGPAIMVFNKSDLAPSGAAERIGKAAPLLRRVPVSALYKKGLEELKDAILQAVVGDRELNSANKLIPNQRQAEALMATRQAIERALAGVPETRWVETIVQELELALERLGEITGKVRSEAVIDQIFSNFCIGK